MHQPDYRDNSGVMQMPWVFLHSIKDYYDMPWMMARHENIKATFNITPPLIEQMKLYYENPVENDHFLQLWYKDTNSLKQDERDWMIKICKSAQFDTMVTPLEHFQYLFQKESLNDAELFDLEVLFILSWCGVYLRQNDKIVSSLIKKGQSFDFNDKIILLQTLREFIKGIFEYYKSLHSKGRISISTTPLNHPILPLLMDMQNATLANQSTNIPKHNQPLCDDAYLQISRAIELFEETFEFKPEIFWPAEGAVDTKSVNLLKKCGIKAIATDEAILFKSLQNGERKNLYNPYNFDGMCMGFRDHGLSDLIGFTYRFWDEKKASDDFVNALENINNENNNACVFVILDGENAWEFYKNNGFDFFDALYTKINQTPCCNTLNMDEVLKLKQNILPSLSPGSWINGEFNTWVGHSEKTKAWDFIYQTKKDYQKLEQNISKNTKEKITKHFLAAECSDWFWWYGDDHHTDFGADFDVLFRGHLISIYNLLKIKPPSDLYKPILKNKETQDFWLPPTSYITPNINGMHNSFFEWLGCGIIDETKLFSTMDKARGPVEKIYYGQDEEFVYFSCQASKEELLKCKSLTISIESFEFKLDIPIKRGIKSIKKKLRLDFAFDKLLEFKIKKQKSWEGKIKFRFELYKDKRVIQTLPGFGELEIDLEANYNRDWFV